MAETLYNFTCLEANLHSLLLSVESLVAGRLEATLVHKEDIRRVLVRLTRHLESLRLPVRLLVNDPAYFYRVNTHIATIQRSFIYITLKIPITTLNFSMELYKVTVVAKSISADNQHATLLDHLPRYFAVDSVSHTFAVWEVLPSLQSGDNFRIVDMSDIQLNTNSEACILALYIDDPVSVQRFCAMLLLNQKPSSFVYLTSNTIAIENSLSDMTLNCPTLHPKRIAACISCHISIPNECTLITDQYIFPASCQEADLFNTTHTVVHQLNLAVIQQFFGRSDWATLKADATVAEQVTLQLPIFLTHSNASTAADEQLTEEFARAMQSVKDGQVIFKSKEDIFRDQLDMLGNTDSPWYSTSQSFIIPVGSVLITLLTIVTIYLVIRVHRLSAIVLALPQVVQANSIPPVWIFSRSPTVTTSSSTVSLGYAEFPWFQITVIMFLLFIFLSGIVRKFCYCGKSSTAKPVRLTMHIFNTEDTVVIPWYELRYALNDYDIVAVNAISHISLSRRCLGRKLRFQWHITVLHKPSQIRILLPQSLPITCCAARRLENIIGPTKRYSVKLYISSSEFNVPLALQ